MTAAVASCSCSCQYSQLLILCPTNHSMSSHCRRIYNRPCKIFNVIVMTCKVFYLCSHNFMENKSHTTLEWGFWSAITLFLTQLRLHDRSINLRTLRLWTLLLRYAKYVSPHTLYWTIMPRSSERNRFLIWIGAAAGITHKESLAWPLGTVCQLVFCFSFMFFLKKNLELRKIKWVVVFPKNKNKRIRIRRFDLDII